MTEKRYTIFGEWHKDCVIDEIRDNTGEYVTIGRVVDLLNENEQLKQAVRELLEEYGNSYYIEIMDKLFNLDYDKWDSLTDWDKRCPYDWEKMIKGDVE